MYNCNSDFCSLSIVSYNINGLSNKIMFPKFLSFINKYDIFFLAETHVTEVNISNYSRYFAGYELKWIPAIKVSNFGRASGGAFWVTKKVLTRQI